MKENINLTLDDINDILMDELKLKYLGKKYENRKIVDIKTSLEERDYETDWGGGYYNELTVSFLTESPTGKSKIWKRVI